MSKNQLALIALLTTLLSTSNVVTAEETAPDSADSPVTVKVGIGASYINLPDYSAVSVRRGNSFERRLELSDGNDVAPTLHFSISRQLDNMQIWGKEINSFGIKSSFSRFNNRESTTYDEDASVRLSWYSFNGDQPGFGFAGGDDVTAKFKHKASFISLSPYMELDSIGTLGIKPSIGLRLLVLKQDFRTVLSEVQTPSNFLTQSEHVDSYAIGPEVGLEKSWRLNDNFTLDLTGNVAVLYGRTKYTGKQTQLVAGVVPTNSQSIREVDRRAFYTSELGSELTYDNGGAKISLSANLFYHSDIAGIRSSTRNQTEPNNPVADLKFKDSVSASLMLNVSQSF